MKGTAICKHLDTSEHGVEKHLYDWRARKSIDFYQWFRTIGSGHRGFAGLVICVRGRHGRMTVSWT